MQQKPCCHLSTLKTSIKGILKEVTSANGHLAFSFATLVSDLLQPLLFPVEPVTSNPDKCSPQAIFAVQSLIARFMSSHELKILLGPGNLASDPKPVASFSVGTLPPDTLFYSQAPAQTTHILLLKIGFYAF